MCVQVKLLNRHIILASNYLLPKHFQQDATYVHTHTHTQAHTHTDTHTQTHTDTHTQTHTHTCTHAHTHRHTQGEFKLNSFN